MSAAARRQGAREAFWDHLGPPPVTINGRGSVAESLDEALETATRVRITPEVISVFDKAWHEAPQDGPPGTRRAAALRAAFEVAGFEVEG